MRYIVSILCAALALFSTSCGQDDDPDGARVLWDKINAAPGFRTWSRAPGYPSRRPSFTAHANAVEIFVSKEIEATLTTPTPMATREWPVGSIIVKEGFSGVTGDSRRLVAVMEKRADGWFWAEYNDDGKAHYSGHPSVCLDCHDNRRAYSDWVYAFELPR
jgi:hypothetical protein